MSLSRLTCSTQRYMKRMFTKVVMSVSGGHGIQSCWPLGTENVEIIGLWLVKQSGEWVPLAAAFDKKWMNVSSLLMLMLVDF